jgi:hypothetical protein
MGQFLIRIAILLLVAKFDNSFKMFLSEYFLSSLENFTGWNWVGLVMGGLLVLLGIMSMFLLEV